jgi:glycosyltransferase involved in cell wall biosynthesis
MSKKRKNPLSSQSSVLFATFSVWKHNKRTPISGSIEPLRDFLVPRIKKFVIIDQLHPGSDDVMPKIEVYTHNNLKFKAYKPSWYFSILKPILVLTNKNSTQITFKIRDFLSVLDWAMRDKVKYDYFIGLESINALAGILLRKLGRIDRVIYYVFDYSPDRFRNNFFNKIYLALDRYCAVHADYIWDVSKAMQPARISAGLDPQKSAPVIHVPIGLYPDQIRINPASNIMRHSLVYMGTLGSENGPDIAIQSLGLIKKKFPDAVLHIIGGPQEDIVMLKKLANKINLKESVVFHGIIPKSSDMSKIIRSCEIGLAPYRNIFGSPRFYADSSKIRAYCASGVPTVTTEVPPLGREIAEKGAAIIVKDDSKSFALGISDIFTHQKKYTELRKNAVKLAKHNTWENSFLHAFMQMAN